ncbi:tetratricopeptide repeat protein [Aporhodopirellula aestuarii]|uniref:Tetratricopeptide repeat protein n=1 Tax=Aporhodopirellula aestuarii TaxID=2950107 RepID=A0ABT0U3C6_9BACT|nr:tetratricopeptide repeat protein [Aporhodopirellula aestuarii]MCM2371154.1 hypothetical protein [Aporhodopirellula aestuarii]
MSRSVRSFLFEEHAAVLPHWFGRGLRGRTVICFDAHLDVQGISDGRLAHLLSCESADNVLARMKPHHLIPDQPASATRPFGFGIEDFLFAASRLGIIDRLIWVAPPYIPIFDMESAVQQLQQTDGVTLSDLASLTVRRDVNNSLCAVEGSLLGIDLTVCHREALPLLELPRDSLVDVDIDYFVDLPSEEVAVSPASVVADLMSLDLDFTEVTISRSVHSGYTPVQHSEIAEQLARHFAGVDACPLETQSHPVDDRENLAPEARELLRRACEFPARGLEIGAQQIHAMECEKEALGVFDVQRGLIEAAIGILWGHVGELASAVRCYHAARGVFDGHPELALEIARLCLETGQSESARAFLLDALRDDKTSAAAHFYLGVLAIAAAHSTGSVACMDEAAKHLQIAHDRTPAWDEVLERLVYVHTQRGDHQSAELFHARRVALAEAVTGHAIDPVKTGSGR